MNFPKACFTLVFFLLILFPSSAFSEKVATGSKKILPSQKPANPTPMEGKVSHRSQDGALQAAPHAKKAEPPKKIVEWQDEGNEEEGNEPKLNISGTKTFEMKKAEVKGDIGHFSTENFDSIPGFHLDQSLHLEINGSITRNAKVNAVLDDKEDEDRRFTINIDGPVWDFTMGDFPLDLKDLEFILNKKEVRGILAQGNFHPNFNSLFLFSQSKGSARREQFRGAGHQQEFRLMGRPIVQNSERVMLDGRLLTRGNDYLIDYEEGIIKFLPAILPIEITNWVVVEYEVSDSKLAFKRNLVGSRLNFQRGEGKKLGFTWFREADDTTPKTENNASGTARPMEHHIFGFDGEWRFKKNLSLKGESSVSILDPNKNSDLTAQDQKITGHASKISLLANGEKLGGEVSIRRVGKNFKLVGRENGVTELGERGLVNDVLKSNGRFSYNLRPKIQLFGGLERSKTNLSADSAFPSIEFRDTNAGVSWKYKDKSLLETRFDFQKDEESLIVKKSDRDKTLKTFVWDHDFGRLFTQTKVEHTNYGDLINTASGSRVLQMGLSLGSDYNRKLTWSVSAAKITLDDDIILNELRSDARNYSLDLNFEPNRILSARGIFQWRTEDDLLVNSKQKDEIADSRIRYQPNNDLITNFKYKIENTSKVIRDPNLDPAKYIRPPSLPVPKKDQEEVVGRFENPVQKSTANFSANYRIGEKVETNFDWKKRDLKDRATRLVVSNNDRKIYEIRYSPIKQLKLISEFERGLSQNHAPKTELKDSVKRIQVRNEFWEGYIFETRFEDRNENDIFLDDNDRRIVSKALDFQRIFSKMVSLETGVQRNVITYKDPSKEWEKKAAFIITPSARNQRYKLFVSHKQIDALKSGNHLEGGLNFSQFIGTDSMIDGEIKRVKSSAGLNGSGYNGTIANAKMVITF